MKMRTVMLTLVKMTLVAGLLWWLAESGKLDFRQLGLLWREPKVLLANVGVWGCATLLLGTLRWNLLLRGLDIVVPYFRTLRLQLIGFFFNTAMPGSVGGDIIKAVYIVREQKECRRTSAMLTVLLDRVVGLAALFVLGGIAIGMNRELLTSHPKLGPIAVFVLVGVVGFVVGGVLVFVPYRNGRDPFDWLFARPVPGFRFLGQVYQAVRCYRERPWVLGGALALSCLIQVMNTLYAWYLTTRLTGQVPDPGVFATVFSVGVMTTALPLAPGGMGVGHLAFERLFNAAGLAGGANVFNVMVLGQLCLNLVGFVPYIFYRAKVRPASEMAPKLEVSAGCP